MPQRSVQLDERMPHRMCRLGHCIPRWLTRSGFAGIPKGLAILIPRRGRHQGSPGRTNEWAG